MMGEWRWDRLLENFIGRDSPSLTGMQNLGAFDVLACCVLAGGLEEI